MSQKRTVTSLCSPSSAILAARRGSVGPCSTGCPQVPQNRLPTVTPGRQDATTVAPVIRGVLCSDYYPAALLHAVMGLVTGGDAALPEAFRLVTLNPARALGLDDALGSIEPGKTVDLIVIDEHGGVPVV